MNLKSIFVAAAFSLSSMSLWADVATSTRTASPDAPVEMISPGRYVASIMPGLNDEMAKKLEQSLSRIPGIQKVKALSSDSSVHFTINNGAKVPITRVQNAVTKIDSDAVMSAPLLEHSLNPDPGL